MYEKPCIPIYIRLVMTVPLSDCGALSAELLLKTYKQFPCPPKGIDTKEGVNPKTLTR